MFAWLKKLFRRSPPPDEAPPPWAQELLEEFDPDRKPPWADELGEAVFGWLAAGALVDKVAGLTTGLWWAMREDGVPGEREALAWERIERMWRVPGLSVRAGGAVVFEDSLRAALLGWLESQPALHGKVIDWACKQVDPALLEGAAGDLASVQARTIRARLELLDPVRQTAGRRRTKELAGTGFGTWVGVKAMGRPRPQAWATGAIGVLGMLVSGWMWRVPDWWKGLDSVEVADLGRWDMVQGNQDLVAGDLQELMDPNQEHMGLNMALKDTLEEELPDLSHKPRPLRRRDMIVIPDLATPRDFAIPPPPPGPDMLPPPERPDMARPKDHLPRMKHLGKFEIGYTEVTQEQYEAVMGKNPSRYKECGLNCPVEMVSWEDAVAYCNKLSEREGLTPCYKGNEWQRDCTGYRLPTEAEWETAARGGKADEVYAGTSDEKEVCKYGNVADATAKKAHPDWDTFACDDGYAGIAPVGRFRPNGFGLFDMTGNVWEWTSDRYPNTSDRVIRGGSWYHSPRGARVALRARYQPSNRFGLVGFRLSRSLP